jgi:hypothetical protein
MLGKVQLRKTQDLVFESDILTFAEKFWGPGKKTKKAPFLHISFLLFALFHNI